MMCKQHGGYLIWQMAKSKFVCVIGITRDHTIPEPVTVDW